MFKFIYFVLMIFGLLLVISYKRIFKYINKNITVVDNFKKLHIKGNVNDEVRNFYYEKIKLVGIVCLACGVLGIIISYTFKNESEELSKIKRPSFSEVSKEYELDVFKDGKSDSIKINVNSREYTDDEAKVICNEAFLKWKEVFCGKNESLENITQNLNLPDSIAEYDVIFEYYLSEESYLDYDGKVDFDNAVYKDGKCCGSLTVVIYLGEYQSEKQVKYTIIEPDKSLEKQIQELVDKQDKYSEDVDLPNSLDSEKLTYFAVQEEGNNWIFLVLSIIAVVVVYIGKDRDVSKKVKERDEQLRLDYAEMVSMFSLLQNTGQSISISWDRIIKRNGKKSTKRYIYEEMKLVKNKIDNGVSERQAYLEFGRRCGIQEYIKFANIIEQNLLKGSNSMKMQLKQELFEASRNKVILAKKKAEECSTKLLLPMIMMLIITMAILIVPAFLNMNI